MKVDFQTPTEDEEWFIFPRQAEEILLRIARKCIGQTSIGGGGFAKEEIFVPGFWFTYSLTYPGRFSLTGSNDTLEEVGYINDTVRLTNVA